MSLIRKWVKRNKLVDAILFGSSVRGKGKPKDIDICLIIPDNAEKGSIDLSDSFKRFFGNSAHVTAISEKGFITGKHTLVKTLLSEGVSVMRNEPVAESYGFKSQTIFTYSLKGFKPADRVRLHYALRGRRGSKGVLSEVNGRMMGKGVIVLPTAKEDMLAEVFRGWNIPFQARRALLG